MNTATILSRLQAVETEAQTLRKLLTKKEGSIIDRIKTWEDVCEELGLDVNGILPYATPQTDDQRAINAFTQLNYIRQALNEGWTPNWDDSSEYKYNPWFDMRGTSAGSGFSGSTYFYDYNSSDVGSRLCYKSEKLAKYAGTQFVEVYKALFIIK